MVCRLGKRLCIVIVRYIIYVIVLWDCLRWALIILGKFPQLRCASHGSEVYSSANSKPKAEAVAVCEESQMHHS